MSSTLQPSFIPQTSPESSRANSRPSEANTVTVQPPAPETYEERNMRTEAAMIMASNERLEWHARARNETVPQTRLYFEKIVAGMDERQWPVQWEDDYDDSDGDDPKGKKAESNLHGTGSKHRSPSISSRSESKESGRNGRQSSESLKTKQRA